VSQRKSGLLDWFFMAVAHAFSAIVGVGFLVFSVVLIGAIFLSMAFHDWEGSVADPCQANLEQMEAVSRVANDGECVEKPAQ